MNRPSTATFKEQIKALVGENKIKQALDEMLAYSKNVDDVFYDRMLQLKRRFIDNENQVLSGLVSDANATLEFNKINHALLGFLGQFNPPSSQPTTVPYKTVHRNQLTRIPNSNSIFVGREKELKELQDAVERYNFIAIEGVGGIGKTEFAIEYIRRYIKNKKQIMWVGTPMKFDVMIHQGGYGEMLKIEQREGFDKFKYFERLLDRDERIIFLGDFDENTDEDYIKFFNQFSLQKAKVIVIARFIPTGLSP